MGDLFVTKTENTERRKHFCAPSGIRTCNGMVQYRAAAVIGCRSISGMFWIAALTSPGRDVAVCVVARDGKVVSILPLTDFRNAMVSTTSLCSEVWFKTRKWVPWLKFLLFLSPSKKIHGTLPWNNYRTLLSASFTLHSLSSYRLTLYWTECRGQVVNNPALYLGGPEFKSRPRDRLSWLIFFVVFLDSSRRITE
jgi:hypothetical protein